MVKRVHPMVLFGEVNNDQRHPMVLSHLTEQVNRDDELSDADRERAFLQGLHERAQIEAHQKNFVIERTNQAVTGKTFTWNDDGTITDQDGEQYQLVPTVSCDDDDAGYAHSDPIDLGYGGDECGSEPDETGRPVPPMDPPVQPEAPEAAQTPPEPDSTMAGTGKSRTPKL